MCLGLVAGAGGYCAEVSKEAKPAQNFSTLRLEPMSGRRPHLQLGRSSAAPRRAEPAASRGPLPPRAPLLPAPGSRPPLPGCIAGAAAAAGRRDRAGKGRARAPGAPTARGRGGARPSARSRPTLEWAAAAARDTLDPGGRRGPGRRHREAQARPPPPGRAVQRSARESGAVPAQSARQAAPRPTPASARLLVTLRPPVGPRGLGGGARTGELTAAPRHWPGRRTRAVAGRPRYPEPLESFQLRLVEFGGRGAGPGRAGRG